MVKKLFQVNITANWGSHGRIAEEISMLARQRGWDTYMAYGRKALTSEDKLIPVGSMADEYWHGLQSRLLDNHGLASTGATRKLIKTMQLINPDIVHLHNIHGYYLNYPMLFRFLSEERKTVVWTLHDCWPITGHCSYFTFAGCDRWKSGCGSCQYHRKSYPISWFFDASARNYKLKKKSFTSVDNLTLVPVSHWLEGIVKDSFLSCKSIKTIHNGINLNVFKPHADRPPLLQQINGRHFVLGVSSNWEPRKGLAEFEHLRKLLPSDYVIVLIGLSKKQIAALPQGIYGVARTNNVDELAAYYSAADVFVNPTLEDNYPTTQLESIACGTPVVAYDTGGCKESLADNGQTGEIVPYGAVESMAHAIKRLCTTSLDKLETRRHICRQWAEQQFDKNDRYLDYLALYDSLL